VEWDKVKLYISVSSDKYVGLNFNFVAV